MISLDFRLAYAQSERSYTTIVAIDDLFPVMDTINTQRTGIANYRNLSLSIPIKYRHLLSEKVPIFILLGFNPYFNLLNHTIWKFDEFEYNTNTEMIVSEINNQEETLEQSFFSHDLILAGFGYKKDKLMFDIYFSGGGTNFNNDL